MKLLRVRASNYKNCCDDFTIDLVAKSRKTSEDKEYELQEIADELYVFNTVAFVGKNASGKTSAIELTECCYSILSEFRLEDKHYDYDNVKLEIIFYHEEYIYKYLTVLKPDSNLGSKANFTEQHIYRKKYYKSKIKEIYEDDGFEEVTGLGARYLHMIAAMYILPAFTNGVQGFFRGIGDLKVTFISSLVNMGVRVIAAMPLVFCLRMGIEALPLSYLCGWTAMLLAEVPLLVRQIRQLK